MAWLLERSAQYNLSKLQVKRFTNVNFFMKSSNVANITLDRMSC